MAFLNRFGRLFRQNLSQNFASSGQAQWPTILNAVRHMSGPRIYVGGLSYGIYPNTLREAFSNFGDVVDAKIVTDKVSGKSKGFGFVSFGSDESASAALCMDGQEINGRRIRVSYSKVGGSSSGYGGGGGGNSGYGRGAGDGSYGLQQGNE